MNIISECIMIKIFVIYMILIFKYSKTILGISNRLSAEFGEVHRRRGSPAVQGIVRGGGDNLKVLVNIEDRPY